MNERVSPPYILTFFICFLLWLLLTGTFNRDDLLAGLLVSIFVAFLSAKNLSILNGLIIAPASVLALMHYLAYFLWALLKANIDLAQRVIAKEIPIDPAMIKIKTTMQSDLGKLILANSITLTPGTLSVDVQGDSILVHWIDCPEGMDLTQATQEIAESFEHYLKGFLK
jgi:multicomponent Na+:H+ antiporter subunit E